MPMIQIPRDRWDEIWFALVSSGPISRVSEGPTYFVSDRQVQMLRRKKLPFQLISNSEKHHAAGNKHA